MMTAAPPERAARRTPAWKRRFMVVSRWLHIYLSMVSFAILFFFAATGLTLNHVEWFTSQQKTVQLRGKMQPQWLQGDVKRLETVEYLRNTHAIHGALKDFRVDDGQCEVAFKGPGYEADALIERATGNYELTETRMGFFAVLNDLHKGRDSGRVWSAVIDVSAGLMTFVSLSGLMLIFFLQRKRFSGLMAAAAGAVLCYLLYVTWVP